MHTARTHLLRFWQEERGATFVEYGLMISLIAIATFAAVVYFGTSLEALYENVLDDIVAAIN
ncbi:Flp family type IVb pilin [Trinickia sp. LjRoot230]|uniref:Flp family type IVb pilin n=1 Tax=Trinickia sp. LjRoot230 TaxID=3342288 RepID=UPI003ECF3990